MEDNYIIYIILYYTKMFFIICGGYKYTKLVQIKMK